MEKGGAVVLTGVSCSNQVAWISLLGTNLALRVSSTDKEKWMRPRFKQVGWDCSPMPFPTRPVCVEKLDGSLPYLEYASREAGGSWRIVSDTEGGRLCAVQHPVGSGFLLVSTARFQGADFLENIQFRHFVASRELGNTVADAVAHNYGGEQGFGLGRGRTVLALGFGGGRWTNCLFRAVLRLDNGRETRRFSTDLVTGKDGGFNLDMTILSDLRGTVRGTLALCDPETGAEMPVSKWTTELPEILTIIPPDYRGLLSTARRDKNVHFRLRFAPLVTPCEGCPVALSLSGPDGKLVSTGAVTVVGCEMPVLMDLPADAPAGTYTIDARLRLNAERTEVARGTFEIVPVRPGQMFVDQDRTLLREGKPFFPLGLYHAYTTNNLEQAADAGFNLLQVFGWQVDKDGYWGRMAAKGIVGLLETGIWTDLVNGVPGWGTNPAYPAWAQRMKTTPGMGFYYVHDEGGVGDNLAKINKMWHDGDEDHPTYAVYCGLLKGSEDLLRVNDVVGLDIYPVHEEVIAGVTNTIGQRSAVGDQFWDARTNFRCPVIAVTQAFGCESETDQRCMTYLSLIHGVQGIIWYCWWDSPTAGVGNYPERLKELKKIVGECKELAPALMAPGEYIFLLSDRGDIRARLCGDATTGRRLICASIADRPVEETLSLPSLAGKKLTGLFGAADAKVDAKGQLSLRLPAYGACVFAVPCP